MSTSKNINIRIASVIGRRWHTYESDSHWSWKLSLSCGTFLAPSRGIDRNISWQHPASIHVLFHERSFFQLHLWITNIFPRKKLPIGRSVHIYLWRYQISSERDDAVFVSISKTYQAILRIPLTRKRTDVCSCIWFRNVCGLKIVWLHWNLNLRQWK